MKIGSANVGTMESRSGEIVEMVGRRSLDFCFLQETRRTGTGAETLGRYKFLWSGCVEGTAGVGFLVEKWVDKVLEVKQISERLMVLRVRVGKLVLSLVSVYAPQVGRTMKEKEEFLISLREVVSAVDARERLVVCGDFNGHVGSEKDGFEGVHGVHGYRVRNTEGEMLLEFADAMNLVVATSWFTKHDYQLVTYESGGCKTVVDYILVRRSEINMVTDVTVKPNEPVLPQHKLLMGTFQLNESGCTKVKEVFVSRCKVWKLKEPEIRLAYETKVGEHLANSVIGGDDVEVMWSGLKKCLLEVASEVCGKTRGKQRATQRDMVVECGGCGVGQKEKRAVQNL